MALVIKNRTACGICHRPLQDQDSIVSFPPFIANRCDPLYVFSDGAFHSACLDQSPLATSARQWSARFDERNRPDSRVCVVCSTQIAHPDDYFGTGVLSRDALEPIAKYNFVHIHLSHYSNWSFAADFRETVETFLMSSAWCGPRLEFVPSPRWKETPR
jgi:hypothetical protein